MAQELAVRGGGGVEEHPAPQRKGVLVRRGAFAVRREVIAVAKMSAPERRLLRERLDSELDAVRGALRKAELLSRGATAGTAAAAAAAPPPPAGGKDGRLSVAGAAAAKKKKRKVSPFVGQGAGEPKRVKTGDRERLAGRLAALATALPDRAVAYLQNRRAGGAADSRGDGGGGAEKDAPPMKGGGALLQLKTLLDKYAPAASAPKKSHGPRRAPPEITPESRRRRALPLVGFGGVSCLSRRQGGAGGGKNMAAVQEEEEEEGVDICGAVSRIAIRDIAEEYGELVEGVGVRLLSPLQRKYVDLAEQGDEYVDICGDASPVVFPAAKGDGNGSTSGPSLSSSFGDTDASSSDSDSSSSSDTDSESESDPGKSFSSRPLPAIVQKEAVHTEKIAEPAVQDLRITSSPPAPAFLPPKVNGTNAPPREPAPEMMQVAEQEELQGQCAAPAPTVRPVTGSPPGPAALPKEKDTSTHPPAPPEAVQCVAPAAPAHPITGGAPPVPVILLREVNSASSQQPPAPPPLPPVAPQVAEPEELQFQVQYAVAAPAPASITANGVSDAVTAAKEEAERRRQLAKERAKAKARRALLEVERAALPDERVHPRDMEMLGIAAFEHVASTVQKGARRAAPPLQVNGGGLRVSPGNPSVLQQLGIFLKADDGSEDDEEEEEQKHQQAAAALASHGDDEEVEDGEIR
ncbi:unnamed protein product [Urochloa decumbens]|uniref:Uncharacterized protein n=1 Tax=Urochloa decumbens TaxID=240449 RepID=A0ABC8ZYB7_9POAL